MYEGVRKQVSLNAFLEEILGEPTVTRTGLRWSSCPHCGASDQESRKLTLSGEGQYFRCFACGSHGDVLEAAALFYRCSHKEAAARLSADKPWVMNQLASMKKNLVPALPERAFVAEAISKLLLSQEGYWDYDVLAYLMKERGLPVELLREAHDKGYLRMLSADLGIASSQVRRAVGDRLLIASGMLNPEKRTPAIVFRPLVFGFPGNEAAEFRRLPGQSYGPKALRHGSALMPWRWNEGRGSVTAIVEGLIDLLSLVAMGFDGEVIGLPGCRQWNAAWNPLLADRTVIIKFDPDGPGQCAAADLSNDLQSEGIRAWVDCPKDGDINDELCATLQRMSA